MYNLTLDTYSYSAFGMTQYVLMVDAYFGCVLYVNGNYYTSSKTKCYGLKSCDSISAENLILMRTSSVIDAYAINLTVNGSLAVMHTSDDL